MPCFDYNDSVADRSAYELMLEKQVARRDAMLCAFFRYLEKQGSLETALDALNYRKCGVKRDAFEQWWKLHQEEDAQKQAAKAKVAERRKKEKARKELLASLTEEQRELLGVATK